MRTLFAALAALTINAPAEAQTPNCLAQWSRLQEVVQTFDLADTLPPGIVRQNATGGCHIDGLTLPAGPNLNITVDSLEWQGQDMQRFVTDGLPPRSLIVQVTGVGFVPDIGDPVFTYLQGIQSRGRQIDLMLDLEWNEPARQLSLNALRINVPESDYLLLQATVENVDFSTKAAMQSSMGSFGLVQLGAEIRSKHMFQNFVLLPIGLALLQGADDPKARVAELQDIAYDHIDAAPSEILPGSAKAALKDLVSDLPDPAGILRFEQTADPGIGPARFLPLALQRGAFESLDDIWTLLEGIRINIIYERL